jgi:hypothetical protein
MINAPAVLSALEQVTSNVVGEARKEEAILRSVAWSIEIVIKDGNKSENPIQHPLVADINSEWSWGQGHLRRPQPRAGLVKSPVCRPISQLSEVWSGTAHFGARHPEELSTSVRRQTASGCAPRGIMVASKPTSTFGLFPTPKNHRP